MHHGNRAPGHRRVGKVQRHKVEGDVVLIVSERDLLGVREAFLEWRVRSEGHRFVEEPETRERDLRWDRVGMEALRREDLRNHLRRRVSREEAPRRYLLSSGWVSAG